MDMIDHPSPYSSALGVKDGRVYETLWERSQLDPLNVSDIPAGYQVWPPVWLTLLLIYQSYRSISNRSWSEGGDWSRNERLSFEAGMRLCGIGCGNMNYYCIWL